MGYYCDERSCTGCPGQLPGGPCYDEAAEMAAEAEYWDARCSEEAANREAAEA